ncbi:MAG: PDZ domain-containing protein [Candidatus Omnitrophica bacterium]|nr:PDZ domain-containing protein [Candidatus Omnitrophota bacterium]MBI3083513.1 PDZ domain-containing protein [Candidatus Omnitrophota bacterium]
MSDQWRVASQQTAPFPAHLLRTIIRISYLLFFTLITHHSSLATQWPSLFRGVVVADSQLGVRVVSVEESSQAYLADLRPEDLIISVQGQELHSIDEFARRSNELKGRATTATVLVFRNGIPRELRVHLFSYPILDAWGVEFIPDFDIRFADPKIGLEYWRRLGRGFEEAGKPAEALQAYLNGLHNVPQETGVALKVAELFLRASQQRLQEGALADAVASLRQALSMLEKLFDEPLTEEELQRIRTRLQATLQALRAFSAKPNIR